MQLSQRAPQVFVMGPVWLYNYLF